MTTPLEQFTNARILFVTDGGHGGPETGFAALPGQQIVVGGFLKQVTANKRANFKGLIDVKISTEVFQGYITGYAPVPEGEDWTTYNYRAAADYDTTGTRPDGMQPPSRIQIYISDQLFQNAEVMDSAGVFMDEGIGTIVRDVIGDRLIVRFERY